MTQNQTHFTTQGLVIREMIVGESDRLVTLLTREHGLIKAFASGAKSIKSKKGAATSLLTYSNFTIKRKKDTLRIYEATPISMFFEIGGDIEILTISQYFCELANEFATADEPCEELLRLILNSLHFLIKEKRYPCLIKAITEFRLAAISGYSPNLVACEGCGKFEDDIMYFGLNDGNLLCCDCYNSGSFLPVDRTMLTAMRHIAYSQFKNLYSFDIPQETARRLSDLTGRYITFQSDHRFSTLEFFESIKKE